ncbi:MAG TPA: hypothetical protein DIU00_22255 [Phycisphaerales bacterium]|nr:hypothetical protein [Phycisphaerales bacterium]
MNAKTEPAVCSGGSPKQTASNKQLLKQYRKATPLSSDNLKDQIGLLLWFLCGPLNKKQCTAGYRLLEILLSARYERGAL